MQADIPLPMILSGVRAEGAGNTREQRQRAMDGLSAGVADAGRKGSRKGEKAIKIRCKGRDTRICFMGQAYVGHPRRTQECTQLRVAHGIEQRQSGRVLG